MLPRHFNNPIRNATRLCMALAAVLALADGAALAQEFDMNEQTFNQWLFNESQGVYEPEAELTLTVEAVDRTCELNDAQEKKLKMAAHGDFARFERQVDQLREKYVGKKYSQNEIGEIYQKIQPLGQVYQAGLLGEESLFAKVLANTLTLEQAAKFEKIEQERRQARYAAKVGQFVVGLERTCPLTDKQRTALLEMLLAETKPPKRFGQYDWYVVMYYASKVPDEKYEAIVDEAQMRAVKKAFAQGAGMKQFLVQQKIIDE